MITKSALHMTHKGILRSDEEETQSQTQIQEIINFIRIKGQIRIRK
jgi:hypothetical protein